MPDPDILMLRACVSYDPETGLFAWRHRPETDFNQAHWYRRWETAFVGKPAFDTLDTKGYFVGTFQGAQIKAHRLAWAVYLGVWPAAIDHLNGCRTDNRIANLRIANCAENGLNRKLDARNTTGFRGVSPTPYGTFMASIQAHGKRHHLGTFGSVETAAQARRQAEQELGIVSRRSEAA